MIIVNILKQLIVLEKKLKTNRNKSDDMNDNLLTDPTKTKSAITNFFCDLLITKRSDWKTATTKERLKYLAKYYSAITFF